MTTKTVYPGLDACLAENADALSALCLLLLGDRARAEEAAFQAALRLAARTEAAPEGDKAFLYKQALLIARQALTKKPFHRPDTESLLACGLTTAQAEALSPIFHRSFTARCALGLAAAGYGAEDIQRLAGHAAGRAARRLTPEDIALARALRPLPDAAPYLSDKAYDRFAERSVPVENALHDARARFDRAAPYLALLVLAFFAFCWWFAGR